MPFLITKIKEGGNEWMELEKKVSEIEILLTKVDSRSQSNTIRLNEHDETLKENTNLIVSIRELAMETKYMREDLNCTIERISKLEEKDASKWDKFKWAIVVALISFAFGLLSSLIISLF